MRDLLADDGSIYVHCDWRFQVIFAVLDEVFGKQNYLNEIRLVFIATRRKSGNSYFKRKHDTIFFIGKIGQ